MEEKETVQSLRICSHRTDVQACTECPLFDNEDCMGDMMAGAADLIERLTAKNADLCKEIEWKDMMIALAQRKQAEAEAERDALREKVPRWISVDDRRPKPGTRVLATDGVFVGEAIYALDGRWSGYGGGILRDCLGSVITHWMPLPETPEVK